jgi:hypothetical protein
MRIVAGLLALGLLAFAGTAAAAQTDGIIRAESYGCSPSNADNSACWSTMAAACIAQPACRIQFGVGVFAFNSPALLSCPAHDLELAIVGAGKGATQLAFNRSDGIVVNGGPQNSKCASHIANLSVTTTSVNQFRAIALTGPTASAIGNCPNMRWSPTILTGLHVQGAWANGMVLKQTGFTLVSDSQLDGIQSGTDVAVSGDPVHQCYAVDFHFTNVLLYGGVGGTCFWYGTYIQGVSFTNGALNFCDVGFLANGVGLDQLAVSSANMDNKYNFLVQSPLPGLQINSVLAYTHVGGVGVWLQAGSSQSGGEITGTEWYGAANSYGLLVQDFTRGLLFALNKIVNYPVGVLAGPASQNVTVNNNLYSPTNTPVINQGTNNAISK